MQPTDQPQQAATSIPNRMYEVRLLQVAEVHTESFPIEAADEVEATGKANEILATKNLEGVQHRIEVIDVTPEQETETVDQAAPEAAGPSLADQVSPDTTGPGPVQTGSLAQDQPSVQENSGGTTTAPVQPENGVPQSGQIVPTPGLAQNDWQNPSAPTQTGV